MKTHAPKRLVAPLLISAALAAPAALPATAAAAPSPLRHDLAIVNAHLRIAIEEAPEELGESLRSAEVVCGLGRGAMLRGEDEAAAADWSTLDQLVTRGAEGAAARVDSAFAGADAALRLVRDRFGAPAANGTTTAKALETRRWVGRTRHGIKVMRTAMAALSRPFADWRGQECEAASRGVEEAFFRVPDGLEQINVGMLRLWRLTGVLP